MGAKMPTNHEDFYRHAREHFSCVYSPESAFLHSRKLFVIKFKKTDGGEENSFIGCAYFSQKESIYIASEHTPSE